MKKRLTLTIATWLGSGYSPVISGTAGSLAALPFAYLLLRTSWVTQAVVIVACYFLFSWAAREAENIFKKSDAGEIVCDEVLGMFITLFAMSPDWKHLLLGFLLFRFFDIVKIFPARWIDRNLGGGHGIMLDDVVAGIYAHIILMIIL